MNTPKTDIPHWPNLKRASDQWWLTRSVAGVRFGYSRTQAEEKARRDKYEAARAKAEQEYFDDGEGFLVADARALVKYGFSNELTDDHEKAIASANRKLLDSVQQPLIDITV